MHGFFMFDIRDLKLITALSKHRHFGRAAQECGISQPAFSMRIRNLEDRLGTAIVRRGNRFKGLTPEGDAMVIHAKSILNGVRSLEEQICAATGEIRGTLSLAVVPTAAAFAARLSGAIFERHPGIVVRIDTASALSIQLALDEGQIDAGITYGDGVTDDIAQIQPLYDEHYMLVCREEMALPDPVSVTWLEAASLPLALLEQGMLNRRILDTTFAEAGASPRVISETNALTTALVMARVGHCATVVPASLLDSLGVPDGCVARSLVDPVVTKPMVLMTPLSDHNLPTVLALREVARDFHDNH